MSFVDATRLRRIQLPTLTKPTGGGLTEVDLPKVGILQALFLRVAVTVAGTLSAPNAYGAASVLNRIRLSINSGTDLINISGPGYVWLLRDFIEDFKDPSPENTGRAAVTATTFNLNCVLPVALNMREETGLVMLQNEQTLVRLGINWEADATVATGATVTASAVPVMQYFEVPANQENWPRLDVLHQILEDDVSIAATGEAQYNWPRGNVYAGVYHLCPTFTTARLRAQQGNVIYDESPDTLQQAYNLTHGRDAALSGGAITGNNRRVLWDLLGSDGLGAYGSVRDLIDSGRLTDLASVINFSATGTLKTVRRQLLSLA